ncbi:hypothetical protein [Brevundimonas diminuta]|uniref:hypothetical protein n=1 Tax=Brevundimonas diminuta TaxID=293 RepID=UPI0030FB64AA
MHHVTRDLLIKQAEREEREAEHRAAEAQKLLAVAIELDNDAAACRATAKALRADAEAKPVEVLTVRFDASEISKAFDRVLVEARAISSPRMCGASSYDPSARR